MKRYLVSLVFFVICVTLVGAQGPRSKLTAAQQAQLFQRNRTMIQSLVSSSVEISVSANDYLRRSRSYKEVLDQFREGMAKATQQEDAARVTELGNHLTRVLENGLTPNLRLANQQIPRTATNWDQLKGFQRDAVEVLEALETSARAHWTESPEVQEMLRQLDKAKDEVKRSVEE